MISKEGMQAGLLKANEKNEQEIPLDNQLDALQTQTEKTKSVIVRLTYTLCYRQNQLDFEKTSYNLSKPNRKVSQQLPFIET